MSERTFAYSFGKFLELSFYNSSAVSRNEFCQHEIHGTLIREFRWNGMVASFEYESVPARRVKIVETEREIRQQLVLRRQTELARIESALVQVSEFFLFFLSRARDRTEMFESYILFCRFLMRLYLRLARWTSLICLPKS